VDVPGELRVLGDPRALTEVALLEVLERGAEAVRAHGAFRLALAGGSTPRALYRALAAARAAVARWQLFFGDERCVPPGHPESNYRMVREAWLDAAVEAPARVHRMLGEEDPELAAGADERELRASLGEGVGLDLVLLGLGSDGHTASLFPGSPALDERERLVTIAQAPAPPIRRLTLTVPALQQARELVFLVQGTDKAAALRHVLAPRSDEPDLPARVVAAGAKRVLWLVDEAAAAELGAG